MVSRHEVQRISDFAEIKTGPFGSALHQADYKATGTPIVTVEHLGERGIIHENLPLVGEEDLKRLSTYKCREGDILFSRVGSIDRNAIVKREEVDWLFSGRLLRVRVDRRKVDSGYLSQVFHTESFKDKVRSVAVGQTMPSLNTQILGGLTVNLPSLDEQKVVAGRLGSADQLIESLKRLISKKQAIKQGMMQELLTGKTRLPGFTGIWRQEKLGSLSVMRSGGTPPSTNKKYYGGNVPWVSISDMTSKGKYILETETTLTPEGLKNSAAVLYEPDAVLYAMYASLGECSLAVGRVSSSQAILGISTKSELDREFLYHYLQFIKPNVKLMGQQGTQSNLNAGMVRNFEVPLPTIDEQLEIANVLNNADEEIQLLSRRLESAGNIKQGMMQELLTGRTRLPVEEVSS